MSGAAPSLHQHTAHVVEIVPLDKRPFLYLEIFHQAVAGKHESGASAILLSVEPSPMATVSPQSYIDITFAFAMSSVSPSTVFDHPEEGAAVSTSTAWTACTRRSRGPSLVSIIPRNPPDMIIRGTSIDSR